MQEIEDKYKDKKVRVLGILADGKTETGKMIMSKKEADYVNILHTDSLINGFLDQIMYVPTTLLVDSGGAMVGDLIVGGKSLEFFTKLIDEAL